MCSLPLRDSSVLDMSFFGTSSETSCSLIDLGRKDTHEALVKAGTFYWSQTQNRGGTTYYNNANGSSAGSATTVGR